MLEHERIGSLLWKLSVPAIIGMMVQGLYNIVDAFFVGRFTGTLGLGRTAIAFPIQMILMGIGMTIGIGGASILSRRMGEKNHAAASQALGNMIVLALVAGVISMIVGTAAVTPLLRLFGANDALMPYAKDYILIILLGSPLITFSMVASSAARAEGNAKVAMNTMILGGIINVALDPLFIIVLGLGVKGAPSRPSFQSRLHVPFSWLTCSAAERDRPGTSSPASEERNCEESLRWVRPILPARPP